MLHALGWTPAQALSFRVVLGSVLVELATEARCRISTDLYLRLPVGVRRACRLAAGDRVLLVADPVAGRLLLHPPVALDTVLAGHHAAIVGV
ncbi:AbrB/MazE/SpoVT family DNA-binding domain-containing protein [Pseudonocardia hydrocarbonoxydans]|uniref:AbrB/MazE/SpoVT family DNA-binding domain-containing protein n=1 Tax=Pseudonocardia hydrocarbonoxydans TaxID=76726 RepID=UPI0031DB8710